MSEVLPFVPLIGTVLGGIFGGDGEGGQIQGQQFARWTPGQTALFQSLLDKVTTGLSGAQLPTAEEGAYLNWLQNYAPWARQTAGVFDPSVIRDYYKEAVYPEFEKWGLPKVREAYAGPGYWGETRAKGESEAITGIARQEAKDIADVRLVGQQSLFNLLTQQPMIEQQKAGWSRYLKDLGGPGSPYWNAAIQMMGLEPYVTVGGYAQQPPSFWQTMAPVWGKSMSTPGFWSGLSKDTPSIWDKLFGRGIPPGYTDEMRGWDLFSS